MAFLPPSRWDAVNIEAVQHNDPTTFKLTLHQCLGPYASSARKTEDLQWRVFDTDLNNCVIIYTTSCVFCLFVCFSLFVFLSKEEIKEKCGIFLMSYLVFGSIQPHSYPGHNSGVYLVVLYFLLHVSSVMFLLLFCCVWGIPLLKAPPTETSLLLF